MVQAMSNKTPRILRASNELTLSTLVSFDEQAIALINQGANDYPDRAVDVCQMLEASFRATAAQVNITELEDLAGKLGLKLNY
ncbi:hypothetical protein LCGC14_1334860 [marine sediment metagenome]|uniref:Uncharacterized protein n=1 Tax=marine sediment metagenome TaxID=412755 RepID=A0A0F9MWC6_9ZZZZ